MKIKKNFWKIITILTIPLFCISCAVFGIALAQRSINVDVDGLFNYTPQDFIFTPISGTTNCSVRAENKDITTADIPDTATISGKTYTVTEIEESGFEGTSITSVNLPNSITNIGESAFKNTSLTSITIPSSVTYIGAHAFSNTYLVDATSGYSQAEFEDGFDWFTENGKSLHNISTLSQSYFDADFALTKMPKASKLTDFSFTYTGDTASIEKSSTSITGDDGMLYIPRWVTNDNKVYTVTTIPWDAFYQCTNIKYAYIPQSVTSINRNVFLQCPLNRVEVHRDNTTYYDYNKYAIYSGTTLAIGTQNVTTIKDGTTVIGESAFRDTGIESITLPSTVETIDEMAFQNCGNLTSITIPDSCTYIDKNAFYVSGLTSATFEKQNYWIANGQPLDLSDGSQNATYLKSTYAACSWAWQETAPDFAFTPISETTDCSVSVANKNITTANIPKTAIISGTTYTVTRVAWKAFYDCSSLVSVDIPSSVTSIGSDAFKECYNLTSINIPSSVTSIGSSAFHSCFKLKSITIPKNVRYIEDHTFYDCSSLTSITIPFNVSYIGESAFENCSGLTSIEIPSNVNARDIGDYAFWGCKKLATVFINNTLDNDTIPPALTSSDSCGYLVYYATTVYFLANRHTVGSYITKNFTQTTSDKYGYEKWVKN